MYIYRGIPLKGGKGHNREALPVRRRCLGAGMMSRVDGSPDLYGKAIGEKIWLNMRFLLALDRCRFVAISESLFDTRYANSLNHVS